MLKTYITKIEGVQKYEVAQYLKYLISSTHKNHIGRTEILNNSQDARTWFKLNSENIRENIRLKQRIKREGKRGWHNLLKESNKSLTFNIPISYNVSNEDIIFIQEELTKVLIKKYKQAGHKVSEEDFFSNIHNQQNKHINFLIPGIDKESKKVIKFIKEKGFRPFLAEDFTKIVDKRLGTNILNYDKENETTAQHIKEQEKILNGEYSLKDLEELAAKKYKNKMLKNLYKMFVRIKKEELETKENSKTSKRIENTLLKILRGEIATKEEKQQARDILGSLNMGKDLSEEVRNELKRETKDNTLKKR